MKDTIYLIISRNGVKELRKNPPDLSSGQVAVRLKVEVSDKFFKNFVDAQLVIPDSAVIEPVINVEVIE